MARHPYLPGPLRRRLAAVRGLESALWALEALLVALVWAVLRRLDPDRAVRVMWGLMSRLGPRLRKSRNVRDNLAIMFPSATPDERSALERATWGQAGALMADFAHLDAICGSGEAHRVEIVTRSAARVFSHGGPVVFAAGHLANFQISTWAGTRLGFRVTALYQPESNPFLDRMIQRRRAAIRCDFIERDGGVRALMRALGEGRPVGLVVDSRFDEGDLVPFFGVDARTITTPARLALRFGCELVPVRVERLGVAARFRVTFYDPVVPTDRTLGERDQALDMTRQLNAHFEQWIRERPDQWYMPKRRWPMRDAGSTPPPPDAACGPAATIPTSASSVSTRGR